MAAGLVADLSADALRLGEQIKETDKAIGKRLGRHRHAAILTSLPGMGVLLAAEFLVAVGGSLAGFAGADHLAAYAGGAPAVRDSGKRQGNWHRPRRYNRMLLRVLYLSALSSLHTCAASKAYYARKRAQGKHHTQALLALARRRLNVLWAMLRDGRCYQATPPASTAA